MLSRKDYRSEDASAELGRVEGGIEQKKGGGGGGSGIDWWEFVWVVDSAK